MKLVPPCAADAHVWDASRVLSPLGEPVPMCTVCGIIDSTPRKCAIACPDCDARGAIGNKMCRTCHGYGEIQRDLTG